MDVDKLEIPKAKTGIDLAKGWAVMYMDGGAKPNDGKGYGGGGVFCHTHEGEVITLSIPLGLGATNNVAELAAYVEALKLALELGLPYVQFVPDSKYVIDGATGWIRGWKKNNWKTQADADVKNKDLWQQVDALQAQMDKEGIKYELRWVKGHSGVLGNEIADDLATKGRLDAELDRMEISRTRTPAESYLSGIDTDEKITKGNKKRKTKADKEALDEKIVKLKLPDFPTLLRGSLILQFPTPIEKGEFGYAYYSYTSNRTTEKERGIMEWVGSNSPFTKLAVMFSNDIIKPLELVKRAMEKHPSTKRLDPMVIRQNVLTKKSIWSQLFPEEIAASNDPAAKVAKLKTRRHQLLYTDGSIMAEFISPPRRVFIAMDMLDRMAVTLQSYLSNKDKEDAKVVDITASMFTAKGKVFGLNEDFDSQMKTIELDKKTYPKLKGLRLTLGVDLPNRADLQRIAKNSPNLRVVVLIREETPSSLETNVIIESSEGYGIYLAPYSNKRWLLK